MIIYFYVYLHPQQATMITQNNRQFDTKFNLSSSILRVESYHTTGSLDSSNIKTHQLFRSTTQYLCYFPRAYAEDLNNHFTTAKEALLAMSRVLQASIMLFADDA